MTGSKTRMALCSRGCGRRTQRGDGVCCDCTEGRAPPSVAVSLLTDAYLAECIAEAIRRDEERKRAAADGAQKLEAAVLQLARRAS